MVLVEQNRSVIYFIFFTKYNNIQRMRVYQIHAKTQERV